MKIHPKVMRLTYQLLIINIIFLFTSCSTLKPNYEHVAKVIIENELISKSTYIEGKEEVYLDFNLNSSFEAFFKENTADPLLQWLSEEEVQMFFDENEVDFFLKQLERNTINFSKFILPKNLILNNTLKEKESINGHGLKSANYYSRDRLFLSSPVISQNGNYALIFYSIGTIDSMSGGIRIYKKRDGVWRFYKEINYWIS